MVLIGAFIALTLSVSEVLGLQVCGKNLADMLDLVCDGRGFHWTSRSTEPRIDKRTALQYLNAEPSSSRRGSGVVNECCKRPCSISHLESYCAAGPGTYLPTPTSVPLPEETAKFLLPGRRPPMLPVTVTPPPPPRTTTTTTEAPTPAVTTHRTRTTARPSGYRCRRIINGIPVSCFRSTFFYVRPVGPRPTRVPVL